MAEQLIEIAHKEITQSRGNLKWRKIYTDTSLQLSLQKIASPDLSVDICRECIARLDKTIIVAGAPDRLDLVLETISVIQSKYGPPSPSKSGLFSLSGNAIEPITTSRAQVLSLTEFPSLKEFKSLQSKPFILRGFASDWPALNEHPWASFDYLHSVAGPGRIVPVEVGIDYRSDSWTQKFMDWDEFLVSLESSTDILYMAQHNLFAQFPVLREDIRIPDYIYTCPTCDFVNYKPPANDEQLIINSWLGPKGTISPAHTDPYFNAFVQVAGRKSVWLAPPSATPFMYPSGPSMNNTSRVDVFTSARHEMEDRPQFWNNVVSHAVSATLEPGDLLFFPPGWWHAMRSEDTSFSVSMWF